MEDRLRWSTVITSFQKVMISEGRFSPVGVPINAAFRDVRILRLFGMTSSLIAWHAWIWKVEVVPLDIAAFVDRHTS